MRSHSSATHLLCRVHVHRLVLALLVYFLSTQACFSNVRPALSVLPSARVSAVAACKLSDSIRVELFRTAFESWVGVPEISEIILVDWGSPHDIHEMLKSSKWGLRDRAAVSVVRIDNAQKWRLGAAVNVGLFKAKSSVILKLDCDTQISSKFLQANTLSGVGFRYADGRTSSDDNGKHLNGVFLARRKDLIDVHALDERFELYGYDDSDLYNRLRSHISSLRRYDMVSSVLNRTSHNEILLSHLEHERTSVYIGKKRFEQFGNCFNKKSLSQVVPWSVQDRHSFALIRKAHISTKSFDIKLSVERILRSPESLQRLLPYAVCVEQSLSCLNIEVADENLAQKIDELVCRR